jgi:hypothetical protein
MVTGFGNCGGLKNVGNESVRLYFHFRHASICRGLLDYRGRGDGCDNCQIIFSN